MNNQSSLLSNDSSKNSYNRLGNQNINPGYGQPSSNNYAGQACDEFVARAYATSVKILAIVVIIEDILYMINSIFFQVDEQGNHTYEFQYIYIAFIIEILLAIFGLSKIKNGKASHQLFKNAKILYGVSLGIYLSWFIYGFIILSMASVIIPPEVMAILFTFLIISFALFIGPRLIALIVVMCCRKHQPPNMIQY